MARQRPASLQWTCRGSGRLSWPGDHMRQRTRVTGALGLAVLVVSVFAVRTSIGRADTIAAVVVRATIPIDRHAGEMLTPPPPDVMPALTPEQAFAEYERQSGEPLRAIPANNTVRLGLLTSPIGAPPRWHTAMSGHRADTTPGPRFSRLLIRAPGGCSSTRPPVR